MNNTELWCLDCGVGSGYLGKKSETNGNHFDTLGVDRAELFLSEHETVSFPVPRLHRLIFARTSDLDVTMLRDVASAEVRAAIDR